MITIANDVLKVTMNPKGAEVTSIINQQTGLEYIWNAAPNWPKSSPVLFPIVGGLKNNTYLHNGKSYELTTRHGFARDTVYAVADQTDDSVTFVTGTSDTTLPVYPFDFKFSVKHTLKGNQLTITYIVENKGDDTMYFSVGAHPAFNVPLVEGTEYNDYYLQFNAIENTGKYPISSAGLIQSTSEDFFNNSDKLPLTKSLFYTDALVFKNLKSSSISLLNSKTAHGVKLSYTNFPFMGIWSAKDADFVCIEPWCGLADTEDTTGILKEKEGINALAAKGIFERSWSAEVF